MEVSRHEVAFIVLHYLKEFPATYECFQRESVSLTKVVASDTPPKDLVAILNEYAQLKLDAVRRERFVAYCDTPHSGAGSSENFNFIQSTLTGLANLISDYQTFRRNMVSRLDVSSDFMIVPGNFQNESNSVFPNNNILSGSRTLERATALSLDITPEIASNIKPLLAYDNSVLQSSKGDEPFVSPKIKINKSPLSSSPNKHFLTSCLSKEELKNIQSNDKKKIRLLTKGKLLQIKLERERQILKCLFPPLQKMSTLLH